MLSTTKAMIGPYSRLSIREMRGKIVYSSTRRCRRGVNTTRTKGGVFATSRCFAGSQAPVRAVPSPHRREHATNGRGMSRWGALGVATTGSALAMLTVTRNPDDQVRVQYLKFHRTPVGCACFIGTVRGRAWYLLNGASQ